MTEFPRPLTTETRRLLDSLDALGFPPMYTLAPAEAREMRAAAAKLAPEQKAEHVAQVADRVLDGPGGPLPVRMYTPDTWNASTGGTLVYFHGGGWVFGDLDTHDASCRGLANSSGLRVVAVQYRLAPEAPHPAALEDAWAAAQWASALDSGLLFIGGDSAGGHIATCVAARARGTALNFTGQLLVYPVTDLSRFDTESYRTFGSDHWLTKDLMEWFRGHYLDDGTDPTHPDVSPLLRPDLSDLPPAVIVAAECDVLQSEGVAYAERLRAAGCDVRYECYEGVIHGFFALPRAIPEGRRAIENAGAELQVLAQAAVADGKSYRSAR